MDLLALVLFNIVFGVILYFLVSIRVTHSVRDYQNQKLKKEIQAHTLDFYRESENYLALMDSKIAILKNLITKAESMGIDFDKLENTKENELQRKKNVIQKLIEKTVEDKPEEDIQLVESVPDSPPKKETKPFPKENRSSSSETSESILGNLFSGTGKAFKSVMGIEEKKEFSNKVTENPIKTNSLDFTVGGNPFQEEEKPKVKDNTKEDKSFATTFHSSKNDYHKKTGQQDRANISIKAALEEMNEDMGKVDRVIYLLKKGYSREEISRELELSLSEINLIETIKMEKSRRK